MLKTMQLISDKTKRRARKEKYNILHGLDTNIDKKLFQTLNNDLMKFISELFWEDFIA